MEIQAYLHLGGRAEEAIEFYKQALAAELNAMLRFKESPEPHPPGMLPPDWDDKVMHADLQIGESHLLMSDGHKTQPTFDGFNLTLLVKSVEECDRTFNALADGGQVRMPPCKTFFSPRFGMLVDKFGVGWIVLTRP